MPYRILLRRDIAIKWTDNNPVLMTGEPGVETDTGLIKIGDGQSPWSALPYTRGPIGPTGSSGSAGSTGAIGPTGVTGPTGTFVPSYKVYTALVTQTGGSNVSPIYGNDPDPLVVGVTYEILDNTDADFTNVGAPNNNVGTFFVATGTTPTAWGNSVIQYNLGAPVAIVLEILLEMYGGLMDLMEGII